MGIYGLGFFGLDFGLRNNGDLGIWVLRVDIWLTGITGF